MNTLPIIGAAAVPVQRVSFGQAGPLPAIGLGLKAKENKLKDFELIKTERAELTKIITTFRNAKKFDYDSMQDLDLQVAKYFGAINNFNDSVYYPYQKVLSLMLRLDPSFTMEDYEVRKETAGSSVNLIIRYSSKLFPQKFIVPLAPMVGKAHTAVDDASLNTRIIDDAWGRAIAKTIAFNTGLGMLCWDEPDYISHAISGNPASAYKPEDWYDNSTLQTPFSQNTNALGVTGQMTNIIGGTNLQLPSPFVKPLSIPAPIQTQPLQSIEPVQTVALQVPQQPQVLQQLPVQIPVKQPIIAPVLTTSPQILVPPSPVAIPTATPLPAPIQTPAAARFIVSNPPVAVPTPNQTKAPTVAPTLEMSQDTSSYKTKCLENKDFRAMASLYAMEVLGILSPLEVSPEQGQDILAKWTNEGGL